MEGPGPGQRIWRLRKLHQSVDAAVWNVAGGGVELRFFYNRDLGYARRFETRVEALAEAAAKRTELERAGWTPHW